MQQPGLASSTLTWLAGAAAIAVGCAGPAFSGSSGAGGSAQAGRGQGGAALGGAGSSSSGTESGGVAQAGSAQAGNTASGGSAGTATVSKDQLILWLAADRGVTLANGLVSRWQDQSDAGADATQVVAAARPRPAPASNGLPMLEFDGDNDALALPEGFADFSEGLSFFAVVQMVEDSECTSIMQLSNGPELADIDFGRQQRSIHYEAFALYITGPGDAFPVAQTVLMTTVHQPRGEVELRIDGQVMIAGSLTAPAVIVRTLNFVGRTFYASCVPLQARIGEILLYSRALAGAERSQVEAYLREKWSCCGL